MTRFWRLPMIMVATSVPSFMLGNLIASPTLKPSDWMSFLGAMGGACITVAGALFVFHRQNAATERRQRKTIRKLLRFVEVCGTRMETPPPRRHRSSDTVHGAIERIHTARDVAQELQAEGFRIAIVAQRLKQARVLQELERLAQLGDDVEHGTIAARGQEMQKLARGCLDMIEQGL